ncbi:MAG: methyltransferase domain-containing protein [Pseudomonadales bacterium]
MEEDELQPAGAKRESLKAQYDDVVAEGLYAEGMARMAVYHQHCQDPVIFSTLGDLRGRSLLDLACGDGFYTRRFRRLGAAPVTGVDLSPEAIARAEAIESTEKAGIEYRVGDAVGLAFRHSYDVVTAIHLLHYLESKSEIAALLRAVFDALDDGGRFVTMIANPEFDLSKHDASDSKTKFGYYFSSAEPDNGGILRFHPGGFEKERELTFELRRWKTEFIDGIARETGFEPRWHEPFISAAGLAEFGGTYFADYLANPQSKLLELRKAV